MRAHAANSRARGGGGGVHAARAGGFVRGATLASAVLLLHLLLLLLLLAALSLSPVAANPNGAPSTVCAAGANSQRPAQGEHGSGSSAVAPFRIDAPATWTSGTPVTITLAATDGGTFKGFMISAFAGADTTGGQRFGTWTATGAKAICTGGASTHTAATARASVAFTWTPPAAGSGAMRIQATVVRALSTWWILPSVRIEEAGAAAPPPLSPPPPPPTTPPPTPPTPTPASTGSIFVASSTGAAAPPPLTPPSSSSGSSSTGAPSAPVAPGVRHPPQASFVITSATVDSRDDTTAVLAWEVPISAEDPPLTSFALDLNANDGKGWTQVQSVAVTAPAQRVAGTRVTATVRALDKSTRYDFRVRSLAAGPPLATAPLAQAPTVTLRTVAQSAPLPPAPAAPTLTHADGATIQAAWPPYTGSVQLLGYEARLETAGSAAATRFVVGVVGAPPRVDFVGLALRVPHSVRARTLTSRGASAWSAPATMQLAEACPGGCTVPTTPMPVPTPTPTPQPPATPAPAPPPPTPADPAPSGGASSTGVSSDQSAGGGGDACPSACHGRGACLSGGRCQCHRGFLGSACERASSVGVGAQDEEDPRRQTPGRGDACYGGGGGGGRFCFDYSFSSLPGRDVCIRVRVQGRGWAGFLLHAPDGMTGGQGYYMYVDADDADAVGLYSIESARLASPDFAEDAAQDVDLDRLVAFYDAAGGFTEFTFYKDPSRAPVLPLAAPQKVDFSWAYGAGAGFSKHAPGAAGKLKFDFFSGGVEVVPQPDLARMYRPALVAAAILLVCGMALHWLRPLQESRVGNFLLQQRLHPLLPGYLSKRGCAPLDLLHTMTFDALPALADLLVVEFLVVLLYCATMAAMWQIGRQIFEEAGQDGKAFAAGHMAAVNITLVLLPISRNSIFTLLFGCPYERLLKFHRQVARPLLATVYVHFISLLSLRGRSLLTSVDPIKFGSHARDGFVAMVAFTLVVGVAWEPIRRRWYAAFRLVHILVAPLAFLFALLHSAHLRWYMLVPLALWCLDQLVRFGRPFLAYSVRADGECRVLPCAAGRVSHLQVRVQGFPAGAALEPGSYAFLYLPSISRTEWHPFSISSHPIGQAAAHLGEAGTPLSFHILATSDARAGSFTRRLAERLERAAGDPAAVAAVLRGMRIDGPYGRLAVDLRRYHTLVLVCGGVGATPMLSLLQFLLAAAKDAANYPRLRRVELVWVNRDRAPFETWEPQLLAQASNDPTGKFALHLFATSGEKAAAACGGGVGVGALELDQVRVEAVAPSSPREAATRSSQQPQPPSPPPPPVPAPSSASPPPPPSSSHPAAALSSSSSSFPFRVRSGRPHFARLFADVLAVVGADQPTLRAAHDDAAAWAPESRAAQVAVLACGPLTMVEQVQGEAQRRGMHFHKETFAF